MENGIKLELRSVTLSYFTCFRLISRLFFFFLTLHGDSIFGYPARIFQCWRETLIAALGSEGQVSACGEVVFVSPHSPHRRRERESRVQIREIYRVDVYGQESRERKRVSRAYRKGETMLGYMDPSPSIRAN